MLAHTLYTSTAMPALKSLLLNILNQSVAMDEVSRDEPPRLMVKVLSTSFLLIHKAMPTLFCTCRQTSFSECLKMNVRSTHLFILSPSLSPSLHQPHVKIQPLPCKKEKNYWSELRTILHLYLALLLPRFLCKYSYFAQA